MESQEETPLFVYVHVERLDGEKEHLQLPKDLQEPMQMYIEEHPNNWKALLKGGLINVSIKPYRKKSEPPMTIAYILNVYRRPGQQRKRTRGQFLTKENWQQPGMAHFFETLRFLQHDYKKATQRRQIVDYLRWKWRKKWHKLNNNKKETHQ
ncbi:DUF2811 domain-containing protein [Enterococcus faecalis]|uniref:DUF2811 domain-containing protein n=1 Tax=Enterococcus faecalis TaxID=1351 RepID=UPI0020330146|nr:hypothetical protein [Enterococcus faecalis]